ncbi:angiopoietin-4-like [Physella acuta]|uniref:angiopoietin-4-like n=1 Tax=Physella acuta TaxID=109671 RepID=UPI0027DE092C|nr:angiopoietin-4-like [Physella acuta]
MIVCFLFMLWLNDFCLVDGLSIDIQREYFYHGKSLFCAQLQCTENITEDTQMSALVNMSLYRISEPEGKILLASISGSDSKVRDHTTAETYVDGKISKYYGELVLFLPKESDCLKHVYECEVYFNTSNGFVSSKVKRTTDVNHKKRDSILIMNLKAKTTDYVKTVDRVTNFLKLFEDSGEENSEELSLSLHRSHADSFQYINDKTDLPRSTELSNSSHVMSYNILNMLHNRINNLTVDYNQALTSMENKLSLKIDANEAAQNGTQRFLQDSVNALNKSIQSIESKEQKQTEEFHEALKQLEDKIREMTKEEFNKTLQLIGNLNRSVEELKSEQPFLIHESQCRKTNDRSILTLPDQVKLKLIDSTVALCDVTTDGGGWIVIQRRVKGDVNFTRNWSDYKNGFGTLDGDFWLGNDLISNLTLRGWRELRFDMTHKGKSYYAVYSNFTVGNEAALYRVSFNNKGGNIKDEFTYHNNMAFTTVDRDNDLRADNCAVEYKGGWWYNSCHCVNMNGVWASQKSSQGIIWGTVTSYTDSLEFVEMKLRKQ